jgi:rRNA-processing protein FCF1
VGLEVTKEAGYEALMKTPYLLLVVSSVALAGTLLVPGFSEFLLVTGPAFLASLVLALRTLAKRTKRWVILDGSNVMYWRDETPQIEALHEVIQALRAAGYTPGVVFDANAGYLLSGKYQHDGALAKSLGLPEERVMVVPKGSPADPAILAAAADLGARVVTNDRYRDWVEQHPEVTEPGHLIRGGFKAGKLWLDFGKPVNKAKSR